MRFQSTPPRGGATRGRTHEDRRAEISIHAPARGGDVAAHALGLALFEISIHAPARGGDLVLADRMVGSEISIHAPARGGDRRMWRAGSLPRHFNPRPREGGRLSACPCSSQTTWNFNPRPREGGRPPFGYLSSGKSLFQSTPPRGGATAKMHSFTCGSLTNK